MLLDLFACKRMRVVGGDQVPASEEEDEETLLAGTPRTDMKIASTPLSLAVYFCGERREELHQ